MTPSQAPAETIQLDYEGPAKVSVKPPPHTLRALATKVAVWTFLGFGSSLVLKLVSSLTLTRLLYPEAFAVMALATIFIAGLQMLTDVGVQTGIIQSKHGDEEPFLNTAWTIQVVRGMVLCLVACALGWPLSVLYKQPVLRWILPALGVSTAILGFKSTRVLTARRVMSVGRLTACELITRALGLAVMVFWAWRSPSLWALVGGTLFQAVLTVIYSHALLPGIRNRFSWNRAAAADLASLGKWVLISTALTFAANQSDRLILGKLLPLDRLGVLMIAYGLYQMPRELVMSISGNIILPAASRKADLPRHELRQKMLHNRLPILLALALCVGLLAVGGDWAVHILYDKRYQAAAWMFPMLVLGLWPRFLDVTINDSLTAIRALHYNPLGSVLRFIVIGVGLPIAFHYYGLPGAVVVIALGDVPNYLATVYGLKRHGLLGIGQDLLTTAVMVGVVVIGIALRNALGFGHPFAGAF
jgi:O-antigen/teichoic acid export membrane protein